MRFFIVISCSAMLSLNATGQPTTAQVVDKALSARDSLTRSYHLVMRLAYKHFDSGLSRTVKLEVWSKGDKLRADETVLAGGSEPATVGVRNVTCKNCERSGYAIMTSTGLKNAGTQVSFYPLDLPAYKAIDVFGIDWRRLGWLDASLYEYDQLPLDGSIRFYLRDATLALATEGGHTVYKSTKTTDKGAEYRAAFDPLFNTSPVLFESDSKATRYSTRTQILYAKASSGDWFPQSITHHRTHHGKVTIDEELTVEKAELNANVPDSVFTLEGLNLEYGQPIAFPEIKNNADYPTWVDGKLDRVNTLGKVSAEYHTEMMRQKAADTPPVPDVPRPKRVYYYIGAGTLAALAIAALVLACRRKS